MRNKLQELMRSGRGQGMVEYILIVALIALVVVVGVKTFGGKVTQIFQDKAKQLGEETGVTENK